MHNLKLVYRVLRKVSEWTSAFYSDIYVIGQENVPADGPVILVCCHHNDSIDVATLAITIPHRRPICFWAKASLFRNPVVGAVLESSGSIPVQRNENLNNVDSSQNGPDTGSGLGKGALFRATFQALDANEVIGLFPEGASYTEPQLALLRDGAALSTMEYARWQLQQVSEATTLVKKHGIKTLTVVPVGIVYTDKSRYQSRIIVEYGRPIDAERYAQRYLAAGTTDIQLSRSVVKNLTSEFDTSLRRLTVNAPNWDVWYAARIARDIVCGGDARIPIKNYIPTAQAFIDRLSSSAVGSSDIRKLVAYYALLQHTGMSHESLISALPDTRNAVAQFHSVGKARSRFLRHLAATIFHPYAILFLPPLLPFLPAYLAGKFAARTLAPTGQEEGQAQYLAVCGGIAYGGMAGTIGFVLAGLTSRSSYLRTILTRLPAPRVVGALGTLAAVYCTIWALFRWHNALIYGNYTRFQRLQASWKVWRGLLSPVEHDISEAELQAYTRPILPAKNPFVKRKGAGDTPDQGVNGAAQHSDTDNFPHSVPSHRLIRHLLRARAKAEAVVSGMHLGELKP